MIRWEDFPQFSEAREICRQVNLEKILSDDQLLQQVFDDTIHEIGLPTPKSVSNETFIHAQERVILRYAGNGRIDSRKAVLLINKYGQETACRMMAYTCICFMERYGIVGGPKIP